MRSVIDVLTGVQSAAVTVRQERCAMVRNRNADCLRCAEACTSGCIRFEDGALAVDLSRCVGCGTCATVCPTCALEAHNPSDADLLAACLAGREGDAVTIACHPLAGRGEGAGCPREGAEVVCLGRVDESLIAGLAARGVREVVLAHADCAACAQAKGAGCAAMVCESANALFAAWGSPARARLQQVACDRPAQNAPIAGEAPAAGGGEPAPSALPKVRKDGTLAHFLPDRRERLLDALAALGEPAAATVATRLWGMVVIDGGKCSSCRMCSTFCPTGAIARFDEPDGTFGVEHYPGDCVKCGTCRAICPEGAIIIRDEVPPAYLLGGEVHRYRMRPRDVEFGAHQIYQTVSRFIDGDSFER